MHQLFYILLCLIIIMYLIIKKRRPDFLMIYALSSIVYYLPLILGQLNDFEYINKKLIFLPTSINIKTYTFGFLNLLICFYWIILKDMLFNKYKPISYNSDNRETLVINRFSFLTLCCLLYSLYNNRNIIFAAHFDKVQLVQNLGIIDSIARYFSMYIIVYAFTSINSNRITKFYALVFIVYSFIMGRRSDFILSSMVCVLFFFIRTYKNKNLLYYAKKYKLLVAVCILVAITIFPLKRTLPLFISGKFIDGIKQTFILIFEPKTYLISESNSITLYINKIVNANYSKPFVSYKNAFIGLIPLIETFSKGKLGGNTFGILFQQDLFPTITKEVMGLAGTFWGEAITNGGFILLIMMLNFVMFAICYIEKVAITSKRQLIRPVFLIIGIHLSFYIHRLLLTDIMDLLKFMLATLFILYIVFLISRSIGPVKFISKKKEVLHEN